MSDPREQVEEAMKSRLAQEQSRIEQERERQQLALQKVTDTSKTDIPGIKPTMPTRPSPQIVTTVSIPELSEKLYQSGNFPTIEQNRQNLELLGLAGKKTFKPKNAGEALSRLGYAATQTIIGAGEEAVFPFKPINTFVKRPTDQVLRITGGLLTPTPVDYAATYVAGKLGLTKAGRSILKKIYGKIEDIVDPLDIPDSFTVEEARQWEKIVGDSGISTADLRKLDADEVKIFKRIEDIAEFYEKNKDLYTAGASVIPEEVIIFDDFIDDVGWEPDEFINFLNEYDETLNIDPSLITSILTRLDDEKTKEAIINIDKTGGLSDSLRKEISEIISEQEKELGEKGEVIPGGLNLLEDQEIEEITVIKPKEDIEQVPEQILEPITEEEATQTRTLRLSPEEKKIRKALPLRIFSGPKQKWRVLFDGKNPWIGDARGVVDALSKAQKARKVKKQANVIIVEQVIKK